MKVSFDHGDVTTAGGLTGMVASSVPMGKFIAKTFMGAKNLAVTVTIELTPEEKAIFKQYGEIGRTVFYEPKVVRSADDVVYIGRVLNKGKFTAYCATPYEAEQLQEDWTDKLRAVKYEMEARMGAAPSKSTFEI